MDRREFLTALGLSWTDWSRLWATLIIGFHVIWFLELSTYPSAIQLLWGKQGPLVFQTAAFFLLLAASLALLWSRWYHWGLLLLVLCQKWITDQNPAMFWSWGFVAVPLLLAASLSLWPGRPRVRRCGQVIFLLYVLSIYWVPFINRGVYHEDWFSGRMVSVFLGTAYHARWPVFLDHEEHSFLQVLSIAVFLIEATLPLVYVFSPKGRRIPAFAMAAFHFLMAVFARLQIWNSLMTLIWLMLACSPPRLNRGKKAFLAVGLVCMTFFTQLWGEDLYWKVVRAEPFRTMWNLNIQTFSRMAMFTQPNMPIYTKSEMTIEADRTYPVGPEVQIYLMRLFRRRSPSLLCEDEVQKVRLIWKYEVEGRPMENVVREVPCTTRRPR